MAFSLAFDVTHEFELAAPFDQVFDLLSDVDKALSYHPNMGNLVELGNGRYRVEMKKLGTEKHFFQTTYTCDYTINREAGTVVWKPLREEGNAWVDGSFVIKQEAVTTHVIMAVVSELNFPLPKMLKGMATKFAENENVKMSEQYISNLIEVMGGGRHIATKT